MKQQRVEINAKTKQVRTFEFDVDDKVIQIQLKRIEDEERMRVLTSKLKKNDIRIQRYKRQSVLGKQTKYTEAQYLEILQRQEDFAAELEQLEAKRGE